MTVAGPGRGVMTRVRGTWATAALQATATRSGGVTDGRMQVAPGGSGESTGELRRRKASRHRASGHREGAAAGAGVKIERMARVAGAGEPEAAEAGCGEEREDLAGAGAGEAEAAPGGEDSVGAG